MVGRPQASSGAAVPLAGRGRELGALAWEGSCLQQGPRGPEKGTCEVRLRRRGDGPHTVPGPCLPAPPPSRRRDKERGAPLSSRRPHVRLRPPPPPTRRGVSAALVMTSSARGDPVIQRVAVSTHTVFSAPTSRG